MILGFGNITHLLKFFINVNNQSGMFYKSIIGGRAKERWIQSFKGQFLVLCQGSFMLFVYVDNGCFVSTISILSEKLIVYFRGNNKSRSKYNIKYSVNIADNLGINFSNMKYVK